MKRPRVEEALKDLEGISGPGECGINYAFVYHEVDRLVACLDSERTRKERFISLFR